MCPDPQVLSIYLDGELPSPWKEKMEAHLAACPKCKERLGNYKHMHDLFIRGVSHIPEAQRRVVVERNGSEEEAISETELLEKSKERVWKKLADRQRYSPTGLVRKSGNIRSYGLWQRRLSVPIPVAAAAAILVVFGLVFFMQSKNTPNNNYQIAEFPNLIDDDMPSNFIPVTADMNSVLQYLDDNGADIIILQLPESRNFSRAGEPQIIRAADYPNNTRRNP